MYYTLSGKWKRGSQFQTETPHRPPTAVCWHSAIGGADDGCQRSVFGDNKQKIESPPRRSVLKYRTCLSRLNPFIWHHSCLEQPYIDSATDSEMTVSEPNMTGNSERPLLPCHFQVGELLNFCQQFWAYWINWFSPDLFCPLLWCREFIMI